MKQSTRWMLVLSVLSILFLFFPYFANAQPDLEGDPDAPIDGGVGILLAAGIGYGLKKIRDKKHRKTVPFKVPEISHAA